MEGFSREISCQPQKEKCVDDRQALLEDCHGELKAVIDCPPTDGFCGPLSHYLGLVCVDERGRNDGPVLYREVLHCYWCWLFNHNPFPIL